MKINIYQQTERMFADALGKHKQDVLDVWNKQLLGKKVSGYGCVCDQSEIWKTIEIVVERIEYDCLDIDGVVLISGGVSYKFNPNQEIVVVDI